MSNDPFDEFLRNCDPLNQSEGAAASDSSEAVGNNAAVKEARTYWDVLTRRRVRTRRRVKQTIALAALAATVIIAVNLSGLASHKDGSGHASVASVEKVASPDPIPKLASDDLRPQTPSEMPAVKRPNPESRHTLERFASAVKDAGQPGSKTWNRAVSQLSHATPKTQQLAVEYVAKIPVYQLRASAFQLVCDASGESVKELLVGWLAEPSLRTLAFDRLASICTTTERLELAKQTRSPQEQRMLCGHLASSPDSNTIGALLRFSQDPLWRTALRSSLHQIHPSHVRRLVLCLRQRDRSIRTSAAFLLASIPGNSVDDVVASMIREKRFLQPAYMTLLARQTPNARSLLQSVMQQPDLAPAFYSAQLNFQSFTRPLQQWLSETQGKKHDTSKYPSVDLPLVFSHRVLAGIPAGIHAG